MFHTRHYTAYYCPSAPASPPTIAPPLPPQCLPLPLRSRITDYNCPTTPASLTTIAPLAPGSLPIVAPLLPPHCLLLPLRCCLTAYYCPSAPTNWLPLSDRRVWTKHCTNGSNTCQTPGIQKHWLVDVIDVSCVVFCECG
jgi:hypothetical protein